MKIDANGTEIRVMADAVNEDAYISLTDIAKYKNPDNAFIVVAFIVTHSPILLGIPNAEILSFDNGSIHTCSYEETDSYQVTEMFINNRKILLERLLEE